MSDPTRACKMCRANGFVGKLSDTHKRRRKFRPKLFMVKYLHPRTLYNKLRERKYR